MKKKLLLILSVLTMAIAAATLCFGCTPDKGQQPPEKEGEYSITLSDSELSLDVFDRQTLTATVRDPENTVVDKAVEWTSSDPTVVKVKDGTLDALKAGAATVTATAEGKSAVCNVTVSALVRPQLVIAQTELTLSEGASSNLSPVVKFKGRTLENAEYGITYSYEPTVEGIAEVSEAGVVSALSMGETEIAVTARFPLAEAAGLAGDLTETITVTVVPVYKFEIAVKDTFGTDIYLMEAADGDSVYKGTSEVEVAEISYNDEPIEEGWEFKSSDESVATVSAAGVITLADTAEEGSTVNIYGEYTVSAGKTIKSNEISFTVRKATVDKTLDGEVTVDLSEQAPSIDGALFGEGFEITDVQDAEKLGVSIWNGGFINKEAVTGLGERKLIVESDKIRYRVDAWVVSKVIKTAADITGLFSPAEGTAVPVVNGYYVLGNDIEAGEAAFKYRGWSTDKSKGLLGTFDGRGHTVDGLKLNAAGGIFGVIGTGGKVQNVAFTNVEVETADHAVVLAYFIEGSVENVFISINKMVSTANSSDRAAGLAGQTADAAMLKNIGVVYNSDISVLNGSSGALEAKANKGAWENVFVVSEDYLFGGSGAGTDSPTQYGKSVKKYATLGGLLADETYYAQLKSAYSEDWDLGKMTFSSAVDYLKAEIDTLPQELTLTIGEPVAVAENARIFNVSLSDNAAGKAVAEGGAVKATAAITEDDNVTVTVSWAGAEKSIKLVTGLSEEEVQTEAKEYIANADDGEDLVVTDQKIDESANAKVTVCGVQVEATLESGKLTIGKDELKKQGIKSGAQTITVEYEAKILRINGVTIVWTINDADELKAMRDRMTSVGDTYDGYLVLGKDIDLGNAGTNTFGWSYRMTFSGIFDGKNHKISNYQAATNNCGLFAGVSGTIRNLAVEGVTVNAKSAAVVGYWLDGGTIENVYVKGTISGDGNVSDGDIASSGAGLLTARIRGEAKIKNVIVELVSHAEDLRLATAFGALEKTADEGVFDNCYAVNAKGYTFMPYGGGWTRKDFDGETNKNFDDLFALWADEAAKTIAEGLGVAAPSDLTVQYEGYNGYYCFNTDDLTVTSNAFLAMGNVTEVKLGEKTLNEGDYAIEGDTFTISKGKIDNTSFGPQELKITGDKLSVTVNLTVAYKLTTKQDVLNLYDYLVVSETNKYFGYLVLGGDVNMENATLRNATAGKKITKSAALNFTGVFDGCGYTISNYEVPNEGSAGISIFSTVTGTIKNLKLEQVTISGKGGALVGDQLRDGGRLENIYVSGTIKGDGVTDNDELRNFGSSLLVGRVSTNNNKIKGVIVNVKFEEGAPDNLTLGSAFGVVNTGYENVTFENCAVICENDAFAYRKQGSPGKRTAVSDWTLQAFTVKNGNNNFTTLAGALADPTIGGILTGLNVTAE